MRDVQCWASLVHALCAMPHEAGYVEREFMTNTTLRERFGIDAKNGATASRLIKEALGAGVICRIGLNLLAGCLMKSGHCPVKPQETLINQLVINFNLLVGYLMGLRGNLQTSCIFEKPAHERHQTIPLIWRHSHRTARKRV